MSSDNKTQYYVVNAFLRTILIFISFFFAEKKRRRFRKFSCGNAPRRRAIRFCVSVFSIHAAKRRFRRSEMARAGRLRRSSGARSCSAPARRKRDCIRGRRIRAFDTRSRRGDAPREKVSPRERSFLVLEDFDEGLLRENQSAAPADIENSLAHFCASRTMNMPRMHDGFRTQICVCVFSKNLLPG